jgi:hypothetical protein
MLRESVAKVKIGVVAAPEPARATPLPVFLPPPRRFVVLAVDRLRVDVRRHTHTRMAQPGRQDGQRHSNIQKRVHGRLSRDAFKSAHGVALGRLTVLGKPLPDGRGSVILALIAHGLLSRDRYRAATVRKRFPVKHSFTSWLPDSPGDSLRQPHAGAAFRIRCLTAWIIMGLRKPTSCRDFGPECALVGTIIHREQHSEEHTKKEIRK